MVGGRLGPENLWCPMKGICDMKFTLGEELVTWYFPKALKSEREESVYEEGVGQKGEKIESGHPKPQEEGKWDISYLTALKIPVGHQDGIWGIALAVTHPAN